MKRFLIALQFLTILPVRIKSEIRDEDFGNALFYFPVIGLLIGILLSLVAFLSGFLPSLVRAAFILIISIIITGGIHLDGLADTCDGFYGFKSKEEILKIMRDSHIGTMGIIGIVSLLLLKFTILTSAPKEILWKALIMMAVFARWTQGLACSISNYARETGKAKYFIEYARRKDIIMGGLFTLALFFLMADIRGVLMFTLSILSTSLFIQYVKRKLGGMTGDTIGATNEIAEVTVLFFGLILSRYNLW